LCGLYAQVSNKRTRFLPYGSWFLIGGLRLVVGGLRLAVGGKIISNDLISKNEKHHTVMQC